MEVFEAIKTLLAVRNYKNKAIPVQIVDRIIEAGRLTGSSQNRQRWDFVVIQNQEMLTQLGQLASSGSYIAQAALAIAVIVPENPTGYGDGARATQDMMLTAWAEGIGSNWVGNANTDAIRQLLNVPQDRIVLNIIPFGYPTDDSLGQGIKNRKPLSEVAHQDKIGQPYQAST